MAQAIGSSVYVGFGIMGGLLFRYLFHQRNWQDKSFPQLIGITFRYVFIEGSIAGILVTIAFYIVQLLAPDWAYVIPIERLSRFLIIVFVQNSLNIAVFQALWSAIYIAITIYRKSIRRETEALRLENSLKEAQLNTLSNQLNPHFLFNALNNIRFMIRKDTAQAEVMLTHLSDLLRYALESSKDKKVTIKEELEIVDHYINLAQIQFNERLSFTHDIDPQSKQYLIPPMVLQTLIENAIKHGIDEIKQGGELSLQISLESEEIKILVRNSFSENKRSGQQTGLGIGLQNTEKRLELLYGPDGKLSSASEGSTFSVRLCIPKELP